MGNHVIIIENLTPDCEDSTEMGFLGRVEYNSKQ